MVAMGHSSGAALAARRFAGWEPLGFEAGDNNWYRFVANGPTAANDPAGLLQQTKAFPFDVTWGGDKYLAGKLFLRTDGRSLIANIHLRRRTKATGYRDLWNAMAEDIPDSWNREFYGTDESGSNWLWPHLYKVLNGDYGGIDPSKPGHPRNDFSAVLVRTFSEDGIQLSEQVSGKWHAVGGNGAVSHVAGSEKFVLNSLPCSKGLSKIWVVYLDTFGLTDNKVPREWAGQSLAYFEVEWMSDLSTWNAVQKQPPPTTFDWPKWKPDQSPPDDPTP
jgi:hypothetical protein